MYVYQSYIHYMYLHAGKLSSMLIIILFLCVYTFICIFMLTKYAACAWYIVFLCVRLQVVVFLCVGLQFLTVTSP
jgi:hypothetical protein